MITSVNCDHVGLDVMIEEVGTSNNGEYCDLHVTYMTKKTAYWHEHIKMNGNCYELRYRNNKLVSICLLEPKWVGYEVATIGKCLIQESKDDLILVKNGWIVHGTEESK